MTRREKLKMTTANRAEQILLLAEAFFECNIFRNANTVLQFVPEIIVQERDEELKMKFHLSFSSNTRMNIVYSVHRHHERKRFASMAALNSEMRFSWKSELIHRIGVHDSCCSKQLKLKLGEF